MPRSIWYEFIQAPLPGAHWKWTAVGVLGDEGWAGAYVVGVGHPRTVPGTFDVNAGIQFHRCDGPRGVGHGDGSAQVTNPSDDGESLVDRVATRQQCHHEHRAMDPGAGRCTPMGVLTTQKPLVLMPPEAATGPPTPSNRRRRAAPIRTGRLLGWEEGTMVAGEDAVEGASERLGGAFQVGELFGQLGGGVDAGLDPATGVGVGEDCVGVVLDLLGDPVGEMFDDGGGSFHRPSDEARRCQFVDAVLNRVHGCRAVTCPLLG